MDMGQMPGYGPDADPGFSAGHVRGYDEMAVNYVSLCGDCSDQVEPEAPATFDAAALPVGRAALQETRPGVLHAVLQNVAVNQDLAAIMRAMRAEMNARAEEHTHDYELTHANVPQVGAPIPGR